MSQLVLRITCTYLFDQEQFVVGWWGPVVCRGQQRHSPLVWVLHVSSRGVAPSVKAGFIVKWQHMNKGVGLGGSLLLVWLRVLLCRTNVSRRGESCWCVCVVSSVYSVCDDDGERRFGSASLNFLLTFLRDHKSANC